MTTVKDTQGRPWELVLTASSARRIHDQVTRDGKPVRVGDLDTLSDLITRLQNDFILLGEIIYSAILPQAEAIRVTKENFLEALHGNTLDEMLTAFLDELLAFLPSNTRTIAAGARREVEAQNAALIGLAIDQLNELIPGSRAAAKPAPVTAAKPPKRPRRSRNKTA